MSVCVCVCYATANYKQLSLIILTRRKEIKFVGNYFLGGLEGVAKTDTSFVSLAKDVGCFCAAAAAFSENKTIFLEKPEFRKVFVGVRATPTYEAAANAKQSRTPHTLHKVLADN